MFKRFRNYLICREANRLRRRLRFLHMSSLEYTKEDANLRAKHVYRTAAMRERRCVRVINEFNQLNRRKGMHYCMRSPEKCAIFAKSYPKPDGVPSASTVNTIANTGEQHTHQQKMAYYLAKKDNYQLSPSEYWLQAENYLRKNGLSGYMKCIIEAKPIPVEEGDLGAYANTTPSPWLPAIREMV